VNETNPTPSSPKGWPSRLIPRSRPALLLLIGAGLVVLAGAAWIIFAYRPGADGKSELLTYRLCIGREQARCPNDAAFVRNEGEDTAAKWTQRQCAGYKARRIIISDGPTPDCDCSIAEVRCSSE
jgi:hypothetical protein